MMSASEASALLNSALHVRLRSFPQVKRSPLSAVQRLSSCRGKFAGRQHAAPNPVTTSR
ncbi:hypothetical protein OK016_01065 [Vibrio chagasii]|nr:hypothetical protein [Vibrio chagasii]